MDSAIPRTANLAALNPSAPPRPRTAEVAPVKMIVPPSAASMSSTASCEHSREPYADVRHARSNWSGEISCSPVHEPPLA